MQDYFHFESTQASIPIALINAENFQTWLAKQPDTTKNWLKSTNFSAKTGQYSLLPDPNGELKQVIVAYEQDDLFSSVGNLANTLPLHNYHLEEHDLDNRMIALAWGMGAYSFTRYKKNNKTFPKLLVLNKLDQAWLKHVLHAIYLIRDLINTPPEDMGPDEFAIAAEQVAQSAKAKFKQIVGDALLKQNYPAIHAVGRGSVRPPRLIDLRWGDKKHPKVTLVGKGVCFDSGGYDLKSPKGMSLMKKDMGGAAHVLGLASLIIEEKLPIQLRVLMPVVENLVSNNAYKPSDVIQTRKGLTVEVGNTDAEGRLILADALTEACHDNPDIVIDFATLTGAARAALGSEVSVFFTNDKTIRDMLKISSDEVNDPLWELPLYTPYRKQIDSGIADICNSSRTAYGGAITAALFLKEFIKPEISWLHIDLMAWNLESKPARPEGGEAMAIRALFDMLLKRYKVE